MPPKKAIKLREPRVILRPLRADSSGHSRYRYTAHAPTSNLFNKPELSDIKLKVCDQIFYAHRLILCAASDVFTRMLNDNWVESRKKVLELQEDDDCAKIFNLFLYFFYSGSIVISESYVIPLFMLADKYNVTLLYSECVRVIENGLKVYIINKTKPSDTPENISKFQHQTSNNCSCTSGPSASRDNSTNAIFSSSSSSYSYSSESESEETERPDILHTKLMRYERSSSVPPNPGGSASQGKVKSLKHLVASETFPLSMVVKMLTFCQDQRISRAALYNLEARLCNQILQDNFGVWNEISQELLTKMLEDDYFYCNEYTLFKAGKSWLKYQEKRQSANTITDILANIRYPIFTPNELYTVEKDEFIQNCPDVAKLVQEAVRFQLFRGCIESTSEEKWCGPQFQQRKVKEI